MRKIFLFVLLGTAYCLGQLGYTQTGLASYYADKFHGRRTSSGEIYNKHKLTAAHRELPFGTMVKVTNLRNNKSVVVKINDRGPWISTRIIDLSYAAAKEIDMIAAGEVPVKIEVVQPAPEYEQHTDLTKPKNKPAPKSKPKPKPKEKPKPEEKPKSQNQEAFASLLQKLKNKIQSEGVYSRWGTKLNLNGSYGIQVGSYSTLENAIKQLQFINHKGYSRVYIKKQKQGKKYLYKVILGQYKSREIAKKNLTEVRRKGIKGFVVKY